MSIFQWLAHLKTDRRGLPVPYVNAYGSLEDTDQWFMSHDSLVDGPALFYRDHGTQPNFKAQNIGRQRECVINGLCQVCARPVPWSRRFLVVSQETTQSMIFEGRDVGVVTEPWLDERCATFAVQKCPALIRRQRTDQLQLVKITRQRQTATIVSWGYLDGPLHEATVAAMPAMWAKILLLEGKFTPAALS